ncbi:hypothetical protein IX91_07825 [Vibrio tubiashii ATCC 19109]|uniref:Uncharacterized protein n=1 Tax=Vibrio tubiashii ATCC 19109 TaxID=1051646 RepID=F9TDT9_9VIBR|nr:hypothetical protein [Vibrio tubiashii]AIW14106.1 hypothetical protein IX91_07825 [Vibrio tubiashii ATCC 19109]EGU46671.1 hypothetical protein VITU9109_04817 [Vibrio tubiashii ATCC 19109]EIF05844.1 hypothetical protein VT1337_01377 [Vibrio tubiashii NCIMB 1337 = ATCC 19106]
MTSVGGSSFVTLGFVFAAAWSLESKVGQQPAKIWLVCGAEFSGLFGSRARRKYFINNVFKLDSQRSAVLVAKSSAVIKVVLSSVVVRCSPLNTSLVGICFLVLGTGSVGVVYIRSPYFGKQKFLCY